MSTSKKSSVKYVEDECTDYEPPMFHTRTINYNHRVDPITVTVSINGNKIPMELDTGSSVSLIPESMYKEQFTDVPLKKTPVRLKTYSGECITPLGSLNVSVSVHNQKGNVDLLVLPQKGPALFGRDWLQKFKLDWHEIKVLDVLKSTTSKDQKLKAILDKHQQVCSEGLGKLQNIKATIYMEDSAQPKFHKARTVPYALRGKVETELERLENGGIISPVQHSNWASPIVPVLKRSGQVRICGDYKVTINPEMKVEKYPLPRIEDVFASLSGGERFTKIDLTQAYLQMEVDETSKELLTNQYPQRFVRIQQTSFWSSLSPCYMAKSYGSNTTEYTIHIMHT
ncbi:uncharacterized protein K02A2.6-like [Pecten maximus]|uniref:uncharacterized protein K02A2.6-like n=1 Tax=Pecten maximus TaxID=6579 RepID=UPI0014587A92|nr:uncharacterized protein K02A2.6-like [Pecten maximus]